MHDPSNTVLAIVGQSPLSGQHLYEAISALMVLATYGQAVQILLIGDAVECLHTASTNTPLPLAMSGDDHRSTTTRPFKSVQSMVESFEFYDLLPVWVGDAPLPVNPVVECVAVPLDQINTQRFKAVLTW